MIEALAAVLLVAAGLGALFGALGRDERDNMRGGCKAAAIRALNERNDDP